MSNYLSYNQFINESNEFTSETEGLIYKDDNFFENEYGKMSMEVRKKKYIGTLFNHYDTFFKIEFKFDIIKELGYKEIGVFNKEFFKNKKFFQVRFINSKSIYLKNDNLYMELKDYHLDTKIIKPFFDKMTTYEILVYNNEIKDDKLKKIYELIDILVDNGFKIENLPDDLNFNKLLLDIKNFFRPNPSKNIILQTSKKDNTNYTNIVNESYKKDDIIYQKDDYFENENGIMGFKIVYNKQYKQNYVDIYYYIKWKNNINKTFGQFEKDMDLFRIIPYKVRNTDCKIIIQKLYDKFTSKTSSFYYSENNKFMRKLFFNNIIKPFLDNMLRYEELKKLDLIPTTNFDVLNNIINFMEENGFQFSSVPGHKDINFHKFILDFKGMVKNNFFN